MSDRPPGFLTITQPTDRSMVIMGTFFAEEWDGGRAMAATIQQADFITSALARRGIVPIGGVIALHRDKRVAVVTLRFKDALSPLDTPTGVE